jgi:hypothetical protein
MEATVHHFCRIRNGSVIADRKLLYNFPGLPFTQFADAVYRQSEISYPKFHKMDNLCKLGFLGADILLKSSDLDVKSAPYQTGVILSNRSSSLDTDLRYYDMVRKGIASPAVFVYSLPNIVIGEICIRHGIKGENTFFISDRYNIPSQVAYVNQLFRIGTFSSCICGWVELLEENYDAFLYLAVKDKPGGLSLKHVATTIEELYHTD